jgi:hypothetical protein
MACAVNDAGASRGELRIRELAHEVTPSRKIVYCRIPD